MKRLICCLFWFGTCLYVQAESAYEFVDALYNKPNSDLHYPSKAALKLYGNELKGLIEKASAVRAEHEKKYPEEKPPFADYSLLSPSQDAYSSYKIFTTKASDPKESLVIVQLLYNQDPKHAVEPDFVYLYLQPTNGSWTIQKIRYQNPPKDLAEQLRSDIKNPS